MLNLKSKLLTTVAFAFCASFAMAQSNQALIDVLIQKGVLNQDEAAKIQSDLAKANAASTSSTTVSAKLYLDVSSINAKTAAGVTVDPSGVGLDAKRFYFGVTHKFDNIWSANINTDSAFSSSTGTVSTFIKTAYVQAQFSPEAIVQVGSANAPWIPFVEDFYTFRYLENTITDRLKYGTSADWGVHFLGKHDMVSYNFAAVEGGGYKNPTRTKSVDFEGRIGIEPLKGLVFAVGGYTGDLGKNSYAASTKQTASRFDLLASYTTGKVNLGAEYFTQNNWGLTTVATPDSGEGYSFWGQYKIDPKWSIFGRYDTAKTSKDLHPLLQDNYYDVGVQFAAIKGVLISLVYKNDHVNHPISASTVADTEEIGLFSEIKF